MSLTTAVHAEPRTPDAITWAVATAAPAHTAARGGNAVTGNLHNDAQAQKRSTRWGISVTMPTSETMTPSVGLSYL